MDRQGFCSGGSLVGFYLRVVTKSTALHNERLQYGTSSGLVLVEGLLPNHSDSSYLEFNKDVNRQCEIYFGHKTTNRASSHHWARHNNVAYICGDPSGASALHFQISIQIFIWKVVCICLFVYGRA